ncbi:MAG: hypothetical protein GC150_07520 [Rhizobiales bacterium]|nr:hypothetical protein [Hyphomicrobiales bacterium]
MTASETPEDGIEALALFVLRETRDGDDLAPEHLALVQRIVNGPVDERAEVAFQALVAAVRTGYTRPAFHGITHLTIDHEGYVYWKGEEVEHFEPGWARSTEAAVEATEVARCCRILEARGVPVNTTSVIWRWEEIPSPSRTPDPAAVYCTRTERLIDVCRPGEDAAAAIARLAPDHGADLIVLPLAEAVQRHEAANRTEPVEITATAWHEALEVLPPADWRLTAEGESFKSIEHKAGAITAIYVRLGERRFTFDDLATLSHAACCDRVRASAAYRTPTPIDDREPGDDAER